jgi:A/G-specific adenine glycosylase
MLYLSAIEIEQFNRDCEDFYNTNKRLLRWREDINPYYILVSEFMLQQTQVTRVIDFFDRFIATLPTIFDLASASQETMLSLWSGLGYNRRALYLRDAARIICHEYNGIMPQDFQLLLKIKGLGEYTARAIVTYSYNIPLIFIETNIRSVLFIYFQKQLINHNNIHDNDLKEIIEQLIDKKNSRDWYYALMDWGTHLKKIHKDKHLQKSHSFKQQSVFQNSFRQIRGKIIKLLLEQKVLTLDELLSICNDHRTPACLESLMKENFIIVENNKVVIKE